MSRRKRPRGARRQAAEQKLQKKLWSAYMRGSIKEQGGIVHVEDIIPKPVTERL